MGFDYQDLSEAISTPSADHYGAVRPEFTEYPRGLPTSSRAMEVMISAGRGFEVGRLRKQFRSKSQYPTWLLCLAREMHLRDNPRAYRRKDASVLVDENQSPRVCEAVADHLGVSAYHIKEDKKRGGADDAWVVNCALEHGHSVIVTSDTRNPAGATGKPHLTKVVLDMARTLSRAFFLTDDYPDRFHTIPMLVHVPNHPMGLRSRRSTPKLIEEEKDAILRHLAGQRTLVLSFAEVAGNKPTTLTHQDVISQSYAVFDAEKAHKERQLRGSRHSRERHL